MTPLTEAEIAWARYLANDMPDRVRGIGFVWALAIEAVVIAAWVIFWWRWMP